MAEQQELSCEAVNIERAQLRRLELMSMVEATTLVTLVCVAVPLKHMFDWPLGSKILGPIHGVAFLAFIWTALQTVAGGGWRGREMVRLFGAAFVPFAGYFNVGWLRRRNGGTAND